MSGISAGFTKFRQSRGRLTHSRQCCFLPILAARTLAFLARTGPDRTRSLRRFRSCGVGEVGQCCAANPIAGLAARYWIVAPARWWRRRPGLAACVRFSARSGGGAGRGPPSRQPHRAPARSSARAKRSPPGEPRRHLSTFPSSLPVWTVGDVSRRRVIRRTSLMRLPAGEPPGLGSERGGRERTRWPSRSRAAQNSTQPILFPRAMTGPPELDVAAIRAYCEQRVPPHARDDVRVELESDGNGNGVTFVERRPPWRPGAEGEHPAHWSDGVVAPGGSADAKFAQSATCQKKTPP